jgi:hypothetical protein
MHRRSLSEFCPNTFKLTEMRSSNIQVFPLISLRKNLVHKTVNDYSYLQIKICLMNYIGIMV